jgi:Zn-finger protein
MSVNNCAICDANPDDKRHYGQAGLADGANCPICYLPICSYHLTTVRWRWRNNSQTDSARICQDCRRSYAHRHWDSFNRDWIT